ncbi:MAG: 50S ribosomal protein L18 [Thermodesulfobacteriota bacterium]
MSTVNKKMQLRQRRKNRIRKKIFGTTERPRLSVFRSARHVFAQIIDDTRGHTFVVASTNEKAVKENLEIAGKKKSERANYVGRLAAQRALEKGITAVVFDRGGFLYHGRVKAVLEGAREAGLKC